MVGRHLRPHHVTFFYDKKWDTKTCRTTPFIFVPRPQTEGHAASTAAISSSLPVPCMPSPLTQLVRHKASQEPCRAEHRDGLVIDRAPSACSILAQMLPVAAGSLHERLHNTLLPRHGRHRSKRVCDARSRQHSVLVVLVAKKTKKGGAFCSIQDRVCGLRE